MKLSLKNIGKIENASIEINGVTVIAGENNTGKSTVGRALFAVFNSFYNIENQIEFEKTQNIQHLISMLYHNSTRKISRRFTTSEIAQTIVSRADSYKNHAEAIKNYIFQCISQYDESFQMHLNDELTNEYISRIQDSLKIPDSDIFKSVIGKKLDGEFNGQISNIFVDAEAEIVLSVKDTDIIVQINENNIKKIDGKLDLHTEAVYIDDPFVLDEIPYLYSPYNTDYSGHRESLRMMLGKEKSSNLIEEIIVSNKLQDIYDKLSTVCSGDIVKDKRSGLGYQRKNTDKILDVKNLSTGFKTFAILKTLLLNGTIEYNGALILDEPEIHLHPEWQLLFAELIVLIQKTFGIHILLNTHSPYFLNAIEVYAAKYEINEKCKYYLASSKENIAYIEDVTNNLEAIYSKLARPLQDLENERGLL